MRIHKIPYILWFPLLVLMLAVPASADDSVADQEQVAAELREVAAFELSVERALQDRVERATSALVTLEFGGQEERLAGLYFLDPRGSVPASLAKR